MPKTASAKKALRQNLRRRIRNVARKKKINEVLKRYKKLVAEGKKEEAAKLLPETYRIIDKMGKTGFIKKGKVNRLKSRLAKKLRPS